MFGLSGLLERIVRAVIYGILVFIVIFTIAFVIRLLPGGGQVSDLLMRFAVILAILSGVLTFLTNYRLNRPV